MESIYVFNIMQSMVSRLEWVNVGQNNFLIWEYWRPNQREEGLVKMIKRD